MTEEKKGNGPAASVRFGVGIGIIAAFPAAGTDTIQTLARTQTKLGGMEGFHLFVSLLGFYLLAGVAAGLFVSLVWAGLNDAFGKGFMKRLWKSVREDRDADRKWAAGIWSLGLSIVFSAVIVYGIHRFVSSGFNNQALAAVFLGASAAAVTGLAILFFFPVFWLSKPVWRLVPSLFGIPLSLLLPVAGLFATLVAAMIILFSIDWRIINFSPYIGLGLLFVFGIALHAAASKIRGVIKRILSGYVFVSAGILLMCGAWINSARVYNTSPALLQVTSDDSLNGGFMLKLGRAVTGKDKDGELRWFGAGGGFGRVETIAEPPPPPEPIKVDREELEDTDPLKTFKFDGNFLVIIVDTLRADRLGIEKYKRDITPNIDQLVKESVFFRETYAQGNRTPHSFGSFLTSRYPSQVYWRDGFASYSPFLDKNLMIFEVLRDVGYRNLAVLRHFYFHPKRNLNQGFAPGDWDNQPDMTIKETNTDISSPDITRRAIARLEELKKSGDRFALWLHYGDPHSRYMEHEEYPITERGREGLIQKYDYEIKFTDRHVGEVLEKLKELELDKNTAVILFSDHGEAFGRHRFRGRRMYFHGQTLYNDLLRVPLLFRVPGVEPRVVDDRVMLLDVAPTMVDMIREQIPEPFMGSSLVPYFFGNRLDERIIRAELPAYKAWPHEMVMMIKGKWKLIHRVSDNVYELYDLENDPNEMKNLAAENPDIVRSMRTQLRNF